MGLITWKLLCTLFYVWLDEIRDPFQKDFHSIHLGWKRSDNKIEPRWIYRFAILFTIKLKSKLTSADISHEKIVKWWTRELNIKIAERPNSGRLKSDSGRPKLMNCRLNIFTETGLNWPSLPPSDHRLLMRFSFFGFKSCDVIVGMLLNYGFQSRWHNIHSFQIISVCKRARSLGHKLPEELKCVFLFFILFAPLTAFLVARR